VNPVGHIKESVVPAQQNNIAKPEADGECHGEYNIVPHVVDSDKHSDVNPTSSSTLKVLLDPAV